MNIETGLGKERFLICVEDEEKNPWIKKLEGYSRNSEEEEEKERKENQRLMQPAVEYLRVLGLEEGKDYSLFPNVRSIAANLTPEQAEDFRRINYVKYVCRDFRRITNPKLRKGIPEDYLS